jgi:rubrerythrin
MDEFDFFIDNEQENEEWFCEDCNNGPMDEKITKCPRCGFKHHAHWEQETELDENGEPIDEKFYEEHY